MQFLAAETPVLLPGPGGHQAVEEKNEQPLEWIEDTEQVLKNDLGVSERKHTKKPGETKEHKDGDALSRLLVAGYFQVDCYLTARLQQWMKNENECDRVAEQNQHNRSQEGSQKRNTIKTTAKIQKRAWLMYL